MSCRVSIRISNSSPRRYRSREFSVPGMDPLSMNSHLFKVVPYLKPMGLMWCFLVHGSFSRSHDAPFGAGQRAGAGGKGVKILDTASLINFCESSFLDRRFDAQPTQTACSVFWS